MGNTPTKPASQQTTEEKPATATSSGAALSSDLLITKLKTYYQNKRNLPGLLSTHEQPIADINLSIIDTPPSNVRPQEEKESKTSKLKPTALTHFEKMHVINQPVPVAEMFDKAPGEDGKLENKPAKHLLVTGAPGTGKTTMSQYIAYQWSIGKLWGNKFDYLFWIPLRNLSQYPTDAKSELSLAHAIHQGCFDNEPTISVASIEHVLNSETHRTLLVLDGYDEVTHLLENRHYPIARMLRQAFRFEYCMLTSRPYQSPSPEVFRVDRHLENTGFTDSNIESYITRYFSGFIPPQIGKGQALLTYLKINLSVWGTAHIPINLALICEIWETETPVRVAGESKEEAKSAATSLFDTELNLTGLYQKMALFLLERYLQKQGQERGNRPSSWVYTECELELRFLSTLAFESLCEHAIILTPRIQNRLLAKFPSDAHPLFDKILASGFLRAADSPLKKEIDRPHYFIHLTFQEYLAAYYLVHHLRTSPGSEEYLKATEWLRTEKYNPHYQMVLKFIAGLLSSSGPNETHNRALDHFWQTLLIKPFDLTGIGHIRLMVRCLEEARGDSRLPYQTKLLDEVGVWLSASCGTLHKARTWLIPLLRTAPWLIKQPNILAKVLAHYESRENRIRTQVITILEELSSVAATPAVLQTLQTALNDPIYEIRNRAMITLHPFIRTEAKPDLSALIKLLGDKNGKIEKSTIEILYQLEAVEATPELLSALMTALGNKNNRYRDDIAELLGRLGIKSPEVLSCLIAALRDENSKLRSTAARMLGRQDSSAATPSVLSALITALADPSATVGRDAAEALTKLGTKTATLDNLNAILVLLNHERDFVQANAAKVLAELDVEIVLPDILPTLLLLLSAKNYLTRINAARSLGRLGTEAAISAALSMLLTEAYSEEFSAWTTAVKALGQLGRAAIIPEVFIVLVELYSNKKGVVGEFYIKDALTKLSSIPIGLTTLLTLLSSQNQLCRSHVAYALSQFKRLPATPEVITAITARLDDEDNQIKLYAVKILGKLGPTAGAPTVQRALVTLLHDEDYSLRIATVETLGQIVVATTDETFTAFTTALTDKHSLYKLHVAKTLVKLGGPTVILDEPTVILEGPTVIRDVLYAFIDIFNSRDDVPSREAAEALVQLGATNAIPGVISALLIALRSEDYFRRRDAAYIFGKWGAPVATPEVISALITALDDKGPLVRGGAALALGKFGVAAAKLDVLIKLIATLRDPDQWVSKTAADALVHLSAVATAHEVIPEFIVALGDPNDWIRCKAAEVLSRLGMAAAKPEVISALVKALDDKQHTVRRKAAEILGQLSATPVATTAVQPLIKALRAEKDDWTAAIMANTLNKFNCHDYLSSLDPIGLQEIISKGAYLLATPISCFILNWFITKKDAWLRLAAAYAFYRAIPITLDTHIIRIHEGIPVTIIDLPTAQAPQFTEIIISTFAKQARTLTLPTAGYDDLRKQIVAQSAKPIVASENVVAPISTVQTDDMKAAGNIFRLVLTSDPKVLSGRIQATNGNITEIIIDMRAPVEAMQCATQIVDTVAGTRARSQSTTALLSTTAAASRRSSDVSVGGSTTTTNHQHRREEISTRTVPEEPTQESAEAKVEKVVVMPEIKASSSVSAKAAISNVTFFGRSHAATVSVAPEVKRTARLVPAKQAAPQQTEMSELERVFAARRAKQAGVNPTVSGGFRPG